jgi:protein-tyrosine phosphatase
MRADPRADLPIRVCFVCLGNICRSPTAEAVMRAVVAEAGLAHRFEIDSAGTTATHAGQRADARSAAAARTRGVVLTSVARQFRTDDFGRFDYVLAMDRENLTALQALAERSEFAARIELLRQYDPERGSEHDVPDPYYDGPRGFEEVLDICERGCRALLARIRRDHAL